MLYLFTGLMRSICVTSCNGILQRRMGTLPVRCVPIPPLYRYLISRPAGGNKMLQNYELQSILLRALFCGLLIPPCRVTNQVQSPEKCHLIFVFHFKSLCHFKAEEKKGLTPSFPVYSELFATLVVVSGALSLASMVSLSTPTIAARIPVT